ncbi:MAG: FCD domain-containing protein [Bacillota bacterium]
MNLSEAEYKTLLILTRYDKPIGSGTISSKITEDKSIDESLSEATVGRLLRGLDHKGYTEKVGFQGRKVTKEGKRIIEKYQIEKEKKKEMEKFINLSRAEKKDELLDLLVARRAIESETARLAAMNASEQDVNLLRNIINVETGLKGTQIDVKFHRTLADISGNESLTTVLKLIKTDHYFNPIFEYMQEKIGHKITRDHKEILKAISANDPSRAESAMVEHINNTIDDVNQYWQAAKDQA